MTRERLPLAITRHASLGGGVYSKKVPYFSPSITLQALAGGGKTAPTLAPRSASRAASFTGAVGRLAVQLACHLSGPSVGST